MCYVQPTFFLCFFSYAASLSGLMLGVIGTASAVSFIHRRKIDRMRELKK
jgi:hypothetical protein